MPLVSAFTLRLCLLFIVVGGVCTQAQPRKVGKGKSQNQQAPANQQTPTPQPQATPAQVSVEQPKAEVARQDRQDKQDQAKGWYTPEGLTALLNALLLVVIGFQTAIYWQQLKLMRVMRDISEGQATSLKKQTEASQTAAQAAELSAKAAEESARIAAQSFSIGERPYLFVEESKLERLTAGRPPSAKLRIRNGGRTPAFKFYADSTFAAAPPEEPNLTYVDAVDEQVTLFLPAGAEVTLTTEGPFKLSEAQISGIRGGWITLYIYGRGGYEDGTGKPYPFDYCLVYQPRVDFLALCPDSVKPKQ